VIFAGPTRAGCGDTSSFNVRSGNDSFVRRQPCATTAQRQSATRQLRFNNTDQAAAAGSGSRFSAQVHAAVSSPFGGNR
jgi:hypothetical protein